MHVEHLFFKHHKGDDYFFKDLSFTLEKGKMHALHGKNGVGKSVLFDILHKTAPCNSLFLGKIVSEKIECLSQQFDITLANEFTFLENLQCSSFKKFPSPFRFLKQVDQFGSIEIEKILLRFHIDPTLLVHKLSGAQRQILALLMKLAKKPKILLLDEPTAALDEENATMVFEFLNSLQNITLFVICHDQKMIHRYATGTHFTLKKHHDGSRILIS
jgi:ABC-type multidrug transport system ATPase subunit